MIAQANVKTDTIDATVLAKLYASGFLPEVWVPDPATLGLEDRSPGAHSASSNIWREGEDAAAGERRQAPLTDERSCRHTLQLAPCFPVPATQ